MHGSRILLDAHSGACTHTHLFPTSCTVGAGPCAKITLVTISVALGSRDTTRTVIILIAR